MRIYNLKRTEEKRKVLRQTSTEAEEKLWGNLRNKRFKNLKFFRQYGMGDYIADFYCPKLKLAIEVDGARHLSEEGSAYDKEREKFFMALKVKTLRFTNRDVLASLERVMDRIKSEIVSLGAPSSFEEGERGSSA